MAALGVLPDGEPFPRRGDDSGPELARRDAASQLDLRHACQPSLRPVGARLQAPVRSERIKDDAQLETAIAYVAANPVTAGLSEEPGRWRWSSHGTGFDAHRATLIGGVSPLQAGDGVARAIIHGHEHG